MIRAGRPTAEQKRHADAACAHPDECRVPAESAALTYRFTITLDDVELVEEIADENGVGVTSFEGLNACVVVKTIGADTFFATYQAYDPLLDLLAKAYAIGNERLDRAALGARA